MVYPDLLKEYIECSNLWEKYKNAPELLAKNNENVTAILPVQTLIYADHVRQAIKSTLTNVQSIMDINVGKIDIPRDENKASELFSKIMSNDKSLNYGGPNAFMYMVEELIDNVYQHSGFTYGSFGAKLSTTAEFADLAVFDNGITIRARFRESGMIFNQDSEAIVSAVNGLSSKSGQGRGYGLGSTVNLVIDGLAGEVFIASGSGAIYASKRVKERYDFGKERLDGTLITLRVPRPSPLVDVYNYV